MPRRRLVVAVPVGILLLWASACSSGPTQEEFVDHMVSIASPPPQGESRTRLESTYACTFGKISSGDVDALMALDRGELPDRDLSTRVSKVLVECSGGIPTTVPGATLPSIVVPSTTGAANPPSAPSEANP